jgi:hypothetical protein
MLLTRYRAAVHLAVLTGVVCFGCPEMNQHAAADQTGDCWRAVYGSCCETGYGMTWVECWPGPYNCYGDWVHDDYFWGERKGSYGWDPPIEGYTGEIKCEFYEPICAFGQNPSGCKTGQTLRTLYCVGVVPQGEYDCED